MYREARESYSHKFDSPFTAWLYDKSLDTSWLDDQAGEADTTGWYGRIGRRILLEDSLGFVSSFRFHSEEVAQDVIDHVNAEYDAAE